MKSKPSEEYESPELEAEILKGVNGRHYPLTEAVFERIRRNARRKFQKKTSQQADSGESFGKPKHSKK